jgi:hypothetical protein
MPLIDILLAPGVQTLPAPLWKGVRTVAVRCEGDDDGCAQLVDRIRVGAPMPVITRPDGPAISRLDITISLDLAGEMPAMTLAAERGASIDDAQGALRPRRFTAVSGEGLVPFFDRVLDRILPWRSAAPAHARQSTKGGSDD